ncbi:hypothetical protein C8R44DRAFT_737204 [Mycena epipterygia]|nr:hypothetical protein C8R44DRAFT_737204 [Mycena epipterygia]
MQTQVVPPAAGMEFQFHVCPARNCWQDCVRGKFGVCPPSRHNHACQNLFGEIYDVGLDNQIVEVGARSATPSLLNRERMEASSKHLLQQSICKCVSDGALRMAAIRSSEVNRSECVSSNIWRPELERSKMCLWLSAASAQLGPPSNSRSITRSHTAPVIITDVPSVAVNSDAAESPPNLITPAESQVTPPTKISTSDHFKMRPGLKPTATAKAIAENTVANVGIITDALRVIEIRVQGVDKSIWKPPT